MGSPYRMASPEEKEFFSGLIDKMGKLFLTLVSPTSENRSVAVVGRRPRPGFFWPRGPGFETDRQNRLSARSPEGGQKAGRTAGECQGRHVPSDRFTGRNIYSVASPGPESAKPSLIDLPLTDLFPTLQPGFYYLWGPGLGGISNGLFIVFTVISRHPGRPLVGIHCSLRKTGFPFRSAAGMTLYECCYYGEAIQREIKGLAG